MVLWFYILYSIEINILYIGVAIYPPEPVRSTAG
jgi:hypothetical protein